MLKEFKTETRSQFIGEDGEWAQLGSWRPTYYKYEWVGTKQYLVVSDQEEVFLLEKIIYLEPTSADEQKFNIKDLQSLSHAGTYYRWRKSRQ